MTVSALGTQVVVDPTDCPFEVTSVALPAINAAGTSFVYTEHMWDSTSEDSAFSFSAVWRPIGRKRRLERSRIYRADKSSDKRTRNPCAAQHRAATKAAAQINTRLRKQKFHALAALDVDRVFPQEEQLSPNWPRGGQSAARKLPPKKRPVRARLHHDEFSLELPGSDLLRQPVDLERGHRRVCHGDPFVITVWGDRTLGVIVLEYEVESATCNMPGFIPFKVADEVFAQIESRPTSVLRTTG